MVKPPLTPRSENDESTVSTESTVKGNFLPETRTRSKAQSAIH